MAVPRMGMIHVDLACADHPYHNNPTGTHMLPKNITGIRNSGLAIPLFRSVSFILFYFINE